MPTVVGLFMPRGLQIRDTADCKSALRRLRHTDARCIWATSEMLDWSGRQGCGFDAGQGRTFRLCWNWFGHFFGRAYAGKKVQNDIQPNFKKGWVANQATDYLLGPLTTT